MAALRENDYARALKEKKVLTNKEKGEVNIFRELRKDALGIIENLFHTNPIPTCTEALSKLTHMPNIAVLFKNKLESWAIRNVIALVVQDKLNNPHNSPHTSSTAANTATNITATPNPATNITASSR